MFKENKHLTLKKTKNNNLPIKKLIFSFMNMNILRNSQNPILMKTN